MILKAHELPCSDLHHRIILRQIHMLNQVTISCIALEHSLKSPLLLGHSWTGVVASIPNVLLRSQTPTAGWQWK